MASIFRFALHHIEKYVDDARQSERISQRKLVGDDRRMMLLVEIERSELSFIQNYVYYLLRGSHVIE